MSAWRFALTKRWAGYLVLAIVFAIVCVFLCVWQLNRRAEAREEIDRIDANYASEPVPLDDALASLGSFDTSQKWKPVEMTGTYLTELQTLVRNRPYNGSPGFEVLVPFQLADGSVFIVDRGWVSPGERQDTPDAIPDAPGGTVTVTARLKAGEPTLPGRSAPAGQIATVNLPDMAERVGEPTYTGAYGLLMSEDPSPATRPFEAAKPARDEVPHLSYAFQWLVFALFGFIGLGYALVQEYRVVNADDPEEIVRAEERRLKREKRAKSDAEVEDELLDAR